GHQVPYTSAPQQVEDIFRRVGNCPHLHIRIRRGTNGNRSIRAKQRSVHTGILSAVAEDQVLVLPAGQEDIAGLFQEREVLGYTFISHNSPRDLAHAEGVRNQSQATEGEGSLAPNPVSCGKRKESARQTRERR